MLTFLDEMCDSFGLSPSSSCFDCYKKPALAPLRAPANFPERRSAPHSSPGAHRSDCAPALNIVTVIFTQIYKNLLLLHHAAIYECSIMDKLKNLIRTKKFSPFCNFIHAITDDFITFGSPQSTKPLPFSYLLDFGN